MKKIKNKQNDVKEMIKIKLSKMEHKINPNIEYTDNKIVLDNENSFLKIQLNGWIYGQWRRQLGKSERDSVVYLK